MRSPVFALIHQEKKYRTADLNLTVESMPNGVKPLEKAQKNRAVPRGFHFPCSPTWT